MTSQPPVKCFACLSQTHTDIDGFWNTLTITKSLQRHTIIIQVHRHVHTKKLTHEYTHAHAYTHTLSLPFSRLGTIAVSKCQRRSIWKAAVITVKAGHQWGARLTLLTCLHQHTWTASLAKQQFSHGASQNKVHCSHTLQWRKSSPTLHTHTMLICCIHTQSTETIHCSHEIKRSPESRRKLLFPIDFTC